MVRKDKKTSVASNFLLNLIENKWKWDVAVRSRIKDEWKPNTAKRSLGEY